MAILKQITVTVADAAPAVTFRGREAWALDSLLMAGERGCTPISNPAPRWSSYIHRLRKAGVAITTSDEKHEAPYQGYHGRYTLASPVKVVERRY